MCHAAPHHAGLLPVFAATCCPAAASPTQGLTACPTANNPAQHRLGSVRAQLARHTSPAARGTTLTGSGG